MEKYIGCKIIEAEYCCVGGARGYWASFHDGKRWIPKQTFEKYYLKLQDNPDLLSEVSIGQDMVKNFIKEVQVFTVGEKTTMVRVILINDFELIETSTCVDPMNYDECMGTEICMKKIDDKIWYLLGFLLQTAISGTIK